MAALRKNNLASLRQVCREFTVVCQQLDLFAGALVALDGSKCKAVNAPERPVTPDKLATLLPQLAQRIEGSLQDLDGQENQEDAGPRVHQVSSVKTCWISRVPPHSLRQQGIRQLPWSASCTRNAPRHNGEACGQREAGVR